ncbi:MAG: TrmB family transcriptional regulator [Halobacteriota archaeon]
MPLETLKDFGLKEKEARFYLVLLRHGPKTVGELAKELGTYREDAYRTLITLSRKGVVEESISKPIRYSATDPEKALDMITISQAHELHRMEAYKQEALEILRELGAPEGAAFETCNVIRGRSEVMRALSKLTQTATESVVVAVIADMVPFIVRWGVISDYVTVVQRSVDIRCVTEVTPHNLNTIQQMIEGGIAVHHWDHYDSLIFTVVDSKESMVNIDFDLHKHQSQDLHTCAFWCNSTNYAKRLTSIFDDVWRRSIPAQERIQQLLNE